jgi:hypothetical protein
MALTTATTRKMNVTREFEFGLLFLLLLLLCELVETTVRRYRFFQRNALAEEGASAELSSW